MITITDQAAEKAKSLMNGNSEAEGLRIQVLPGGCAGFSYKFLFDKKREGDNLIEVKGLSVFIDSDSMGFLEGSKIDFVESLNESGFKVENPNATSTCGCGSSFG